MGRAVAALGAHADGVARGNRDLSGRTEAQASAIEQAAASMEELAASVKHNTESARATQAIVARAREATGKAIEAATLVIARMESMQEATAKVSDIVGLIDGIAAPDQHPRAQRRGGSRPRRRARPRFRGRRRRGAQPLAACRRLGAARSRISSASASAQVTESSAVVDQVAEAIAAINGHVVAGERADERGRDRGRRAVGRHRPGGALDPGAGARPALRIEMTESTLPPTGAARRRYARWLRWGTRASLALLVVSFGAYAMGLVAPPGAHREPAATLDAPVGRVPARDGDRAGWGWTTFVHRGDLLNLVGIALLASCSIPSLAAVIPIFRARGQRALAVICALEIAVLALAASGLLAGGH